MVKGYDLFGDHGRNLPTPHGSGTRPMYADMGKSCYETLRCQQLPLLQILVVQVLCS